MMIDLLAMHLGVSIQCRASPLVSGASHPKTRWYHKEARVVVPSSFLARLLDALGTGVERSLPGLGREFLLCLLLCVDVSSVRSISQQQYLPALFLSRKALSSSSSSLLSFFAALRGLALPPVPGVSKFPGRVTRGMPTFSTLSTHVEDLIVLGGVRCFVGWFPEAKELL